MRTVHTVLISVLLLAFPGIGAAGEAPGVEEIVRQANLAAFYAGADGRAETRMTIVDGQGREQVRQFTILRRDVDDGGDQQFLVLFSYPADVRKTVFMVHKKVGSEGDHRRLYLPDLDLVKRIAAGDKRTSFVGSHFFYEDVSGRGLDEDEHTLVETTDEHYVVRNVPKDPQSVEFSEYTVWIDRRSMMPVRTEYTNAGGEVYRRIEALEIREIDGHPTATKMKASDLAKKAHTINEMRYVHYDLGLPEDVFSERSLRTPPRKWLQRPEK
jgi:hypothetical protein